MRLGDATWPEVDGIARRRPDERAPAPIVLVPVGSTEQHGPHLPLGHRHDHRRGARRTRRPPHRRPDDRTHDQRERVGRTRRLPRHAVDRFTSDDLGDRRTGPQRRLGGRRRVGERPRRQPRRDRRGRLDGERRGSSRAGMVAEVATAARRGARRPACRTHRDLDDARDRSRSGSTGVGCRRSGRVDRRSADEGVRAISSTGVLGDPEGASGREGERFITAFVDDLVHQIERWRPLDPGASDG
jgi:mycofactocin precursor peptide peptidase